MLTFFSINYAELCDFKDKDNINGANMLTYSSIIIPLTW